MIAGKVADIVAGEATVTSKKGNEIKKKGTEDDPAVVIERSGVSVILSESGDHIACGLEADMAERCCQASS